MLKKNKITKQMCFECQVLVCQPPKNIFCMCIENMIQSIYFHLCYDTLGGECCGKKNLLL